ANIMITPQLEVKVLDFGLAKPTAPASPMREREMEATQQPTAPGVIVGTVCYMSPEQVRGTILDGRSDIFSLGCVLYEAATGRPPFQAPTTLSIMQEIATVNPPPPSTINVKLPAAFDRVIQCALAKDRKDRYGSALELAEALGTLDSNRESA